MLEFIKQSILHPVETGAIYPSSKNLADLITNTTNLSNCNSVVELGPGTGVFTKKILNKIPEKCSFFTLETNPNFTNLIRKNYPQVKIYQDSAINIGKYLKKNKIKKCDAIISSLPWTTFSKGDTLKLLNSIDRSLKPKGEFLTYAYLQDLLLPNGIRFKKLLNKFFSQVNKTEIVWKNLPPAFIYHCIK